MNATDELQAALLAIGLPVDAAGRATCPTCGTPAVLEVATLTCTKGCPLPAIGRSLRESVSALAGVPSPDPALLRIWSAALEAHLATLGLAEEQDPIRRDLADWGISTNATPAQLDAGLRRLREESAKADPIRRAVLRQAAIAAINKSGAAAMVDSALGPDKSAAARRPPLAFPDEADQPWPDAVDGEALLGEIAATLARFVVLPPGAATAIALWIVHSHTIDVAQITPRLALVSPTKRCGKTTVLTILAALVRRPLQAANLTAAVMFRVIEARRPTLLVDEADSFLADSDELRGVINAGHAADGAVLRCDGEDHEPRMFPCFAAVAIASIGNLPATVEDRAVKIPMCRKAAGETVARFRRREAAALADLRRRCARWAADHAQALADARPDLPPALNDRQQDGWEPLLAIADVAGGIWPGPAREAALALAGQAASDEDERGVELLRDVRDVFAARQVDRMASKDLTQALVDLEARPWGEANHGLPLTASRLAHLLAGFDVRPRTIRLADGKHTATAKGYLLADFSDAFGRYLPAATVTADTGPKSQGNPAKSAPSQKDPVTDCDPAGNTGKSPGVTVVTVAKPGSGGREQATDENDPVPGQSEADLLARARAVFPGAAVGGVFDLRPTQNGWRRPEPDRWDSGMWSPPPPVDPAARCREKWRRVGGALAQDLGDAVTQERTGLAA